MLAKHKIAVKNAQGPKKMPKPAPNVEGLTPQQELAEMNKKKQGKETEEVKKEEAVVKKSVTLSDKAKYMAHAFASQHRTRHTGSGWHPPAPNDLFRTGPFTYAYVGPLAYEFQTVGGHPITFFAADGGRHPLAIDKAGTAYALLDGLVFDAKVLGADTGRMAETYAAKRGTFPATKMRVRRL
eukprot:jgi/Mesvir1/5670/Mv15688-RA.1